MSRPEITYDPGHFAMLNLVYLLVRLNMCSRAAKSEMVRGYYAWMNSWKVQHPRYPRGTPPQQ